MFRLNICSNKGITNLFNNWMNTISHSLLYVAIVLPCSNNYMPATMDIVVNLKWLWILSRVAKWELLFLWTGISYFAGRYTHSRYNLRYQTTQGYPEPISFVGENSTFCKGDIFWLSSMKRYCSKICSLFS